jgi:hypothetical protein
MISVLEILHKQPWVNILSAASFLIAAFSFAQKVSWDRKHYALEILRNWDLATQGYRTAMGSAFPELYSQNARISKVIAERIYAGSSDQDKCIHQCLVSVLNHMTYIAVAYRSGATKRAIIEDHLGWTLVRWHDMLTPWLDLYNRDFPWHIWKVYEDLVEALKKKRKLSLAVPMLLP